MIVRGEQRLREIRGKAPLRQPICARSRAFLKDCIVGAANLNAATASNATLFRDNLRLFLFAADCIGRACFRAILTSSAQFLIDLAKPLRHRRNSFI
jgi:hypothetical protein